MKLLTPEVDIVPGERGAFPPAGTVADGTRLPGSIVVRIDNPLTRINAYTVGVRCEALYWQDRWYTVTGLPPSEGALAANVQPDESGPNQRSVRVYVAGGGSRDVLIRFDMERLPEARAGRYPVVIEIEPQIASDGVGGRRQDRVISLPVTATVRPFYAWQVDVTPNTRRTWIALRRSAEFEAVITSESNDWLYCELQLPPIDHLLVETPTQLVAVPPPEPGQMLPPVPGTNRARPGIRRGVPIMAVTQLRALRGRDTPQSIPLTARRIDAPSLPHADDDRYATSVSSVVSRETGETSNPIGDRTVVYRPPIPSSLLDLLKGGANGIKGLVAWGLGIILVAHLAIVGYERMFHNINGVILLSSRAEPGGKLGLRGKGVPFASVTVGNDKQGWYPVPTPKQSLRDLSRYDITLPDKFKGGDIVKVKLQRHIPFLPWLGPPLLPHMEPGTEVTVGTPPVPKDYRITNNGVKALGNVITLAGLFPDSPGKVMINGNPYDPTDWSDSKITATIPATVKSEVIVVGARDSEGKDLPGGTTVPNPLAPNSNIGKPIKVAEKPQDGGAGDGKNGTEGGGGGSKGGSSPGGSSPGGAGGSKTGSSPGGGKVKPGGGTGTVSIPFGAGQSPLFQKFEAALAEPDADKRVDLVGFNLVQTANRAKGTNAALAKALYAFGKTSQMDTKIDPSSVQEAAQALSAASKAAGNNDEAQLVTALGFGWYYCRIKDWDEAIKRLKDVDDPFAKVLLSYAYIKNGDQANSQAARQMADSKKPGLASAWDADLK